MKQIQLGATINIYESLGELPIEDQALMAEAAAALDKSYAPYSLFRVAAAVRMGNGALLSGANQENAAYPLCLCAEMVALSAVSAEQPGERIDAMAITVKTPKRVLPHPISPCGACRQTILEFEQRQGSPIRLLLFSETGLVYELKGVRDLLPLSFEGGVVL